MLDTNTRNLCRLALIGCAAHLLAGCSNEREPSGTPSPDATQQASAMCTPNGSLSYVCGPKGAEDIVQIGRSDWLVASGLTPIGREPRDVPGRVYLLNHRTRTFEEWFPGPSPAFEHDTKMFGECPGPLNTGNSPRTALQSVRSGRTGITCT